MKFPPPKKLTLGIMENGHALMRAAHKHPHSCVPELGASRLFYWRCMKCGTRVKMFEITKSGLRVQSGDRSPRRISYDSSKEH